MRRGLAVLLGLALAGFAFGKKSGFAAPKADAHGPRRNCQASAYGRHDKAKCTGLSVARVDTMRPHEDGSPERTIRRVGRHTGE